MKLAFSIFWGALFAVLAFFWTDSSQARSILYKAAIVHTMTGNPLQPGEVFVQDGKIVAVGKSVVVPSDTKVVDLGDVTLLPGFIDAYSQVGLAGGSDESTREVTPGFSTANVIDWKDVNFREALAEGTTTLAASPGTQNVIAGISCVIKTAGTASMRMIQSDGALLLSLCSDPAQGNRSRSRPDSIYIRQPTNRMGVVWILRSAFDHASRNLPFESGAMIRESLQGKRPVFSVSRTTYDLNSLLALGEEFSFSPVAVGGHEAYKMAPRLSKAKVPVILGPLSTGGGQGPEETEPIWNQAGILSRAGVELALAGGNLLTQARFAHRFGLTRELALKAVTRQPAELLRVADRIGSLAPGLDADLVAFDGDPLEFTTAIRWVMVDGIIYEQQEEGGSNEENDL